jgi:Ca-activated chloride channel homolog
LAFTAIATAARRPTDGRAIRRKGESTPDNALLLVGMVMQRTGLSLAAATLVIAGGWFQPAGAQERSEGVFRSRVDLVSVTAVVRDRHGCVVKSLTRDDFEVLEGGRKVPILELQADNDSPASVALLVDGSGSMGGAPLDESRRISETVLNGLDTDRDAAALFSFNRRLITISDFTKDLTAVRRDLNLLDTFGSTSLYDAIAGAAGVVAARASSRRAVIVFTDGFDTSSAYLPDEVAAIASSIDVPVYIFAIGESAAAAQKRAAATGVKNTLAALARATGGAFVAAGNEVEIAVAVGRVLDELRHQYVFAFNGSETNGVRPVEIRTRRPKLKVTSRKWYRSGSGN